MRKVRRKKQKNLTAEEGSRVRELLFYTEDLINNRNQIIEEINKILIKYKFIAVEQQAYFLKDSFGPEAGHKFNKLYNSKN